MDLYTRSRNSFRRILKDRLRPIDFLVKTTGAVGFSCVGQVTRIDAILDPQTNTQIRSPLLAVTVSVLDLPRNSADNSLDENLSNGFYLLKTKDSLDTELILKIIDDLRVDYTIGFVNFICRALDVDEGT